MVKSVTLATGGLSTIVYLAEKCLTMHFLHREVNRPTHHIHQINKQTWAKDHIRAEGDFHGNRVRLTNFWVVVS